MRVLVILKTREPIVLDEAPIYDETANQYIGSLAFGGDIVLPRENVDYYQVYSDRHIEAFRLLHDRAREEWNDTRSALHSTANS